MPVDGPQVTSRMAMEAGQLRAEVLAELRGIVGADHVIVDTDLLPAYETDWTGRFRGSASAVVRPGSTEEVAAVMRMCHHWTLPVVPQGGNTGLVGGGVPRSGELVLNLSRLAWINSVDSHAEQLSAGSGATLTALQRTAADAGYEVGIDFAARDSATLGGIVATNAGGERVQRYGMTRNQVVGVEAVLADGTVVRRMSGLVKDNGGYDLPGLITGSEGTLAVVTAARLRLFPALPERTVALLGLASAEVALDALRHLRKTVDGIEAADIFFDDGLRLVCDYLNVRPPFRTSPAAYLVIEAAGRSGVENALGRALQELDGIEATMASDRRSRQSLWRYREAHTEAIASCGVPLKLDVAVPPRLFPELVSAVRASVNDLSPASEVVLFGHLAEGNLHVNILAADELLRDRITGAVLGEVAIRAGSVSAEHGVGVAKADWLDLCRSPEDLLLMRSIKRAMDPNSLLNPGVLFSVANVDDKQGA